MVNADYLTERWSEKYNVLFTSNCNVNIIIREIRPSEVGNKITLKKKKKKVWCIARFSSRKAMSQIQVSMRRRVPSEVYDTCLRR